MTITRKGITLDEIQKIEIGLISKGFVQVGELENLVPLQFKITSYT